VSLFTFVGTYKVVFGKRQAKDGTELTTRCASGSLCEVAAVFFKLGTLGFGGPAAHIALMEEEVVRRRGWVTRQQFTDILGLTHVIPGPNSTQMAIHLGLLRAGIPGLLVSGACFILPAATISAVLAWFYLRFGALPNVRAILVGVQAAVLALIVVAAWRLAEQVFKSWRLIVLAVAAAAVVNGGMNEALALIGGGLLGAFWLTMRPVAPKQPGPPLGGAVAITVASQAAPPGVAAAGLALAAGGGLLWPLGLFFLQVGATLYGSGYVLVSYLDAGLVRGYGWLTPTQLVDAVAVGQITPGPLLSTAAFVGYLVAGASGAAVATLAIFLPSFFFVLLLRPMVPRLRGSPTLSAFVDAVSACAVGLIVVVAVRLGAQTLVSWPSWVVAAGALLLTLRFRVTGVLLIPIAAIVGWGLGWIAG
jgi:chromate transporter